MHGKFKARKRNSFLHPMPRIQSFQISVCVSALSRLPSLPQDSGPNNAPVSAALPNSPPLHSPSPFQTPFWTNPLPQISWNKEKSLFFQPLPRTHLVFPERPRDTFSPWNAFLLSAHGGCSGALCPQRPLHENRRALSKPNLHFNDTVDKERK